MTFSVLILNILLLMTSARLMKGQRDGDVRLYDGFSTSGIRTGRLEVYISGHGWGTVCHSSSVSDSSGFGIREAAIACSQLGFPSGGWIYWGRVEVRYGSLPTNGIDILLDDVNCSDVRTSATSRLFQCSHSGVGVHDCDHGDDVAIQCFSGHSLQLVPTTGLTGLFNIDSGRLEIYMNEQWGTVCNNGFDSIDATVACRQMGFDGYTAYGTVGSLGYHQASSSAPIWLDDLDCTLSDTTLEDCYHSGIGVTDCSHSEDVALRCYKTGSLRLRSISARAGRLEIYLNGQWGTVCDDLFSFYDAEVACRQLGYSGVALGGYGNALSLGYTSASTGVPVWLTNLRCAIHDTLLGTCMHETNVGGSCTHAEDVAVVCEDIQTAVTTTTIPTSSSGIGSSATVRIGAGIGVPVAILVLIIIVTCIFVLIKKKRRPHANVQQRNQEMEAATSRFDQGDRNEIIFQQDHAMFINLDPEKPQAFNPNFPELEQQPLPPYPAELSRVPILLN